MTVENQQAILLCEYLSERARLYQEDRPERGVRLAGPCDEYEPITDGETYRRCIEEAAYLWEHIPELEQEMYRAGGRYDHALTRHDVLLTRIERYEYIERRDARVRKVSKAARRARKRASDTHYTEAEWNALRAFYGYRCLLCGRAEPEIQLVADHVVPLAKGGSDGIENIGVICSGCNGKKGASIVEYRPAFMGTGTAHGAL